MLFSGIKTSLVFICVLVYLMGSLSFESLHKLFTDHAHTTHTLQQEQDPCHITLFHKERADGCKHATHFVEVDNCTLCDHSLPVQSALLTETTSILSDSYTNYLPALSLLTNAASTIFSADRAPPIA